MTNQLTAQPNAKQPSKDQGGGAPRHLVAARASRAAIRLFDALPKKRRQLLKFELSRAAYGLTNEQVAKAVKINVATLYTAHRSEAFQVARRAMTENMVSVALPQVVNHSIDSAGLPGKDGFQDRRMLMEVAQMYEPSQTVTHAGKIQHEHEVGDRLGAAIFKAAAHRRSIAAGDADLDAAGGTVIDVTPTRIDESTVAAPEPEVEEFQAF